MLDPVSQLQHQPIRTLGSIVQEFAQTVLQLLMVSLLLLGIGGLTFKVLGEDGWLPSLLAAAWNSGPGYLFAATVALLVGGSWVNRALYRRPAALNRSADALFYGCFALGVFFAARLFIGGTI